MPKQNALISNEPATEYIGLRVSKSVKAFLENAANHGLRSVSKAGSYYLVLAINSQTKQQSIPTGN